MRYLCLYKSVEGGPPTQAEMESMGALIHEMTTAGTLLAAEGCLPSARGVRIRQSNGQVTVTDGPFTESKEVIGGFAIIEAASKEHAIELTRRFLTVAGDGESEVRELHPQAAV